MLTKLTQNFAEHGIALLEAGNGIHDLVVGAVAASLVQFHGQFGQFSCVGGVVTGHVLHQSHQLFHRRMVMMLMVVMVMIVVVMMVVVVMVVIMMMLMMVLVAVVAAGNVVVMNVHGIFSFFFFVAPV